MWRDSSGFLTLMMMMMMMIHTFSLIISASRGNISSLLICRQSTASYPSHQAQQQRFQWKVNNAVVSAWPCVHSPTTHGPSDSTLLYPPRHPNILSLSGINRAALRVLPSSVPVCPSSSSSPSSTRSLFVSSLSYSPCAHSDRLRVCFISVLPIYPVLTAGDHSSRFTARKSNNEMTNWHQTAAPDVFICERKH